MTHLTKREEDSLEECSRLVQTLLESFVQLNVELPGVLTHVLSTLLQQDTLQVDSDFCWLQVGDEDSGACKGSVRCPFGGFCQGENLSPVRQRWKNFKCFRERARLVPREKEADSRAH
jgi:hypothetical protein